MADYSVGDFDTDTVILCINKLGFAGVFKKAPEGRTILEEMVRRKHQTEAERQARRFPYQDC